MRRNIFLSRFVTKLFVVTFIIDHHRCHLNFGPYLCLGLVGILHRFEHPFVPKSCVQGLCVAAEKKERKKEQKTEEVPAVQKKIFLLKKKVVVAETKERKCKKRKREKQKMSIRAAVLSLFCLFCVTIFVSMLTSLSKL
jgi:hypothetical protein